jgi:hypothetical protein
LRMSLQSRREYLAIAQKRYRGAKTKNERSRIIDEVVKNLCYHRKYASPKRRLVGSRNRVFFGLRVEVPVRSYAWDEERPGALQVDLVEHNGGSSLGQF